jgi:hypothetical protein
MTGEARRIKLMDSSRVATPKVRRVCLILTLIAACTLASSNGHYASQLSISKINRNQRLDRPIDITITNLSSKPDIAQLQLDELQELGWSGLGDVIRTGLKGETRHREVPAHAAIIVRWYPSRSIGFKPKIGKTYRIRVYGKEALAGGGPTWHSNQFRFVSGKSSIRHHAPRKNISGATAAPKPGT